MTPLVYTFGLGQPCTTDPAVLGGKGASLVAMTAAGLPVPPGFIITTQCCREYLTKGCWPEGLEREVKEALSLLCAASAPAAPLLVAVRSGAEQSMPGMMDTLLNCPVEPFDCLKRAIDAVFASWNSPRAVAYRRMHGIGCVGTAVTVQAMFPSEVSGVVFTMDPNSLSEQSLLIEASAGLGENVVSGRVTPDHYAVCRQTMNVRRGIRGQSGTPVLPEARLVELAELALRAERHFGKAMDVEWGFACGRWALLQCRPIAAVELSRELAAAREDERRRLRERSSQGRKVWVAHNLGETMRCPTPLTWDIMRHFMSGSGGFGRMYSELGYRPSPRVKAEGFLDLIAGRVYADADRAAELFWHGLPLAYDRDALLDGSAGIDSAPDRIDPSRTDQWFLLRLPVALGAMARAAHRWRRMKTRATADFEAARGEFEDYVARQRRRELPGLTTPELLQELHARRKALDDFGWRSLLPGFFGGSAMTRLEALLRTIAGDDEGLRLASALTVGDTPDLTVRQNLMLAQVGRGELAMEKFIEIFGHRAAGEMELAQPRWREDLCLVEQLASRAARSARTDAHAQSLSHRNAMEHALPRMLGRWGASSMLEDITELAHQARELLPARELGRHCLMMGYELVRAAIVELARRWQIGDDVFFLQLSELDAFERQRDAVLARVAPRRLRWRALKRLSTPDVIDSRRIDELFVDAPPPAGDALLKGHAVSTGVGVGTAVVLRGLTDEAPDVGDYVLVCPSTDPGWTVLLMGAAGLVVERGGALSHGAIVARDMGIPAVVCPGATTAIPPGRRVRVDGNHGVVTMLEGPDDA
jgi:pyruvate,water dikinase